VRIAFAGVLRALETRALRVPVMAVNGGHSWSVTVKQNRC